MVVNNNPSPNRCGGVCLNGPLNVMSMEEEQLNGHVMQTTASATAAKTSGCYGESAKDEIGIDAVVLHGVIHGEKEGFNVLELVDVNQVTESVLLEQRNSLKEQQQQESLLTDYSKELPTVEEQRQQDEMPIVIDSPSPNNNNDNQASQQQHPSVRKIIQFSLPAIGVWLCSPVLSMIDTASVGMLAGTAQQAALNPAVSVTDYGGLLVVRLGCCVWDGSDVLIDLVTLQVLFSPLPRHQHHSPSLSRLSCIQPPQT